MLRLLTLASLLYVPVLMFSFTAEAAEPVKPESLLAKFQLPKVRRPTACRSELRMLTSDAKVLLEVADEFFGNKIDPKSLRAFLNDVYREQNELGISALLFDSEESAKQARVLLASQHEKEQSRVFVVQDRSVVILVWRDAGATDESFAVFKDFIRQQVKPPHPKD